MISDEAEQESIKWVTMLNRRAADAQHPGDC
jgi:hypothetical protein